MNTVFKTIQIRRSVRTFSQENLSAELIDLIRKKIKELSDNPNTPYPVKPVCSLLLMNSQNLTTQGEKLGTYGIIKNPKAFLVCSCKNNPEELITTGFIMESIILALTDLGLGTCWLGGTFSRSTFAKAVQLPQDQIIPAISPIGFTQENKSLTERFMRTMAKADARKPADELFFLNDFSTQLSSTDMGALKEAFEAVRLGPSASNKQPWRMVKQGSSYHFYLKETPRYNTAQGYEIQLLDMGIAMYHFSGVCSESGFNGTWGSDNPELAAPDKELRYIGTYHLEN